jgi:hypothetical protein
MLTASLSLTPKTFAYSGTSIYVDPATIQTPAASAHVGDTFNVSLAFANMTNLFGIQYTLYWNNSVLQVIRVHDTIPGGLGAFNPTNTTDNNFNATYGQMNFISTSVSLAYNGSATFRTITFNITSVPTTGNATSVLAWGPYGLETIFGDNAAHAIDATTHNGEVTLYNIIPEYTPLIMLLAAVLATSAVVAIYKRKQ